MAVPKFDPAEIENPQTVKTFGGKDIHVFNNPCCNREAVDALLRKEPYWMMSGMFYSKLFCPMIMPDNIARGFVIETEVLDPKDFGGKDMFGIEWEFVPTVGGSMVRPGNPFAVDANELLEKVVWPDLDQWDWEGCAKRNADYFQQENCYVSWLLTGWYERLISFMDFENAIMALYDEDQKDAVHKFFDRLTNLYLDYFERFTTYFPQVGGFFIHDDWGSQKETFFSPALAEEMIVPYMRRVTGFLHSKGKFCEMHSCGQNMKQIENYIKAGWDIWQGQPMNNTRELYEKYGDQIILGVYTEGFNPDADEETQRAAAREFVDTFMKPGKPAVLNFLDPAFGSIAFTDELYRYSRLRASGEV